jgi:hypothetical protein
MSPNATQEPPIDRSLEHYMEAQALLIAAEKASTPQEKQAVEQLAAARAELMRHREAHALEATAKRHARGEIYSAARVAAINSMGPTREALDENVKALYRTEADAQGVLKAHARTHFAHGLVSQRLLLRDMPADIAPAARAMQAAEEAFAAAWMRSIDDPAFADELRELQREALLLFRTASRPMWLVTEPAQDELDDAEAQVLGKAWSKLDTLAGSLGVTPLSHFIALSDEGSAGGMPAGEVLATADALLHGLATAEQKVPSKKAVVGMLTKMREVLERAEKAGGRAHFEVDV